MSNLPYVIIRFLRRKRGTPFYGKSLFKRNPLLKETSLTEKPFFLNDISFKCKSAVNKINVRKKIAPIPTRLHVVLIFLKVFRNDILHLGIFTDHILCESKLTARPVEIMLVVFRFKIHVAVKIIG